MSTSADSSVRPEAALKAAKAPVGSGWTPAVGQLVALLLIAVGVVGVQEALSRTGIVNTSWTTWTLTHLEGRLATFSLLVLFVVLVLVGLALLVLAFRPRPRKTLTLAATTGVYLRTADLARIVRHRIDGTDGVTDVEATSSRKRLTVDVSTVQAAASDSALEQQVRERLVPVLEALTHPPKTAVTITHQDLT